MWTVSTTTGSSAPNNTLHALRFGAVTNATISSAGQAVGSNARITLPAGSRQAQFSVRQTRAGQAVIAVPVVVEDDCGDWPTFVGGGAGAS